MSTDVVVPARFRVIGRGGEGAPSAPQGRQRQIARILAVAVVLLIASRQFVGPGLSLGYVATIATAPIWWSSLRRYRGAAWLMGAGLLATLLALWLSWLASQDHVVTTSNLVLNTLLIASLPAEVGVLLWARGVMPTWALGALYGFGMLVSAVTRNDIHAANPWKFALGIPIGVILAALARGTARRWVEVVALLGVAAASAALDSRSYFAEFAVAAALIAWLALRSGRKRRRSALGVVSIFGLLLVAAYNLGTEALTAGLLGEETQARSLAQIDRAGSVIAGGRPEMGATASLFLYRPIGFGAGTIANFDEIRVAKQGMAKLSYDPDNGYVENFLFGLKVELHSMLGDLWAYAGLAGVLLGFVCVLLLLVVTGRGIADGSVSGVVLFAVVQSLWSFLFNPLYASQPVLVLALGLGLPLVVPLRRTLLSDRQNGASGSPRSGTIPPLFDSVPRN